MSFVVQTGNFSGLLPKPWEKLAEAARTAAQEVQAQMADQLKAIREKNKESLKETNALRKKDNQRPCIRVYQYSKAVSYTHLYVQKLSIPPPMGG